MAQDHPDEETGFDEGATAPAPEAAPRPPVAAPLEPDYKDLYLRALAELENYRKRTDRDKAALVQFAGEDIIRKLLDPYDSFTKAIEELEKTSKDLPEPFKGGPARVLEGLRAVRRQLRDLLISEGVEAVPSEGVAFDPHIHEALLQVPSATAPEGVILQTLQPGYSLRGKLLRPARVAVSSGPGAAPPRHGPESATAAPPNSLNADGKSASATHRHKP